MYISKNRFLQPYPTTAGYFWSTYLPVSGCFFFFFFFLAHSDKPALPTPPLFKYIGYGGLGHCRSPQPSPAELFQNLKRLQSVHYENLTSTFLAAPPRCSSSLLLVPVVIVELGLMNAYAVMYLIWVGGEDGTGNSSRIHGRKAGKGRGEFAV